MTEPPFHYPHEEGQPPPETHMQETEQFPVPPPEPPFWQRYRAAVLAAVVVVVLLVGALVWVVVGSSSSSAAPPPSSAPPSPAPSSGKPAKPDAKQHPVMRGTLTAQDGDTWTVKTDGGDTLSVTISDKTKFGTTKEPVDKAKFTVNSKVLIAGKNADGKVDARRIRLAEK